MSLIRKLIIPTALTVWLGIAGITGCGAEKEKVEQKIEQISRRTNLDIKTLKWLKENGIPLDSIAKYDERFSWAEYGALGERNQYTNIDELYKAGIVPGQANRYDERFKPNHVVALGRSWVPPEIANGYDGAKFDVSDIVYLSRARVPSNVANEYDEKFSVWKIEKLHNARVDLDIANEYGPNFSAESMKALHKSKVPSKIAKKYMDRAGVFNGEDIALLYNQKISYEEADRYIQLNERYGTRISAEDMVFFKEQRIPFEEIENRAYNLWLDDKIIR